LSEGGGGGLGTLVEPGSTDGAFLVAGKGDEAGGEAGELGPRAEARTFTVRRVGPGREFGRSERRGAGRELGLGDELAEVLITGAVDGEEWQHAAVLEGDLGANAGADGEFGLAGAAVEPGRAVETVAVEEGDGGQLGGLGGADEILGAGAAAQKTKRTAACSST